jgi:hypothetical protein
MVCCKKGCFVGQSIHEAYSPRLKDIERQFRQGLWSKSRSPAVEPRRSSGSLNEKAQGAFPAQAGSVSQHRKKEHASHSNSNSPDRRGRFALVGEPLHPNAGHYQVNSERGRRHCRGVVAPKRFWTISFSRAYTRRDVGKCR